MNQQTTQKIQDELDALFRGEMVLQCLMAAQECNLINDLENGCDLSTLAKKHKLEPDRLSRLLGVLQFSGFIDLTEETYRLTDKGRFLLPQHQESVYPWLQMRHQDWYRTAWQNLTECLRQGNSAFEIAHGQGFFEYLAADEKANHVFNQAMLSSADSSQAIVEAFDFSPYSSIVDVGGGHGGLLGHILQQQKNTMGVIFDLPHVIATARESLQAKDLQDRIACKSGSFFEEVPAGHDLYLLRYIIHDWDDESCVKILTACRQAMDDNSRLLVLDSIVQVNAPHPGPLFSDLQMMVFVNGRERSLEDFNSLYGQAGLQLEEVIDTRHPVSIMFLRTMS